MDIAFDNTFDISSYGGKLFKASKVSLGSNWQIPDVKPATPEGKEIEKMVRSVWVKEIETFVKADQIPFTYLEKPYYLAPQAKGEKVYALLREAMLAAGVIGVARVVMHTKEHLAALVPDGNALVLNTIRWADEIRPRDELDLPAAGKSGAKLKEGEMKMAVQLVRDMTGEWKPADYRDKFTSAIHALAAIRLKAGKTEQVTSLEGDDLPAANSNVVDLTDLLRQSLQTRKSKPGDKSAAAKAPAEKPSEIAKTAAKPKAAKTARRKAA